MRRAGLKRGLRGIQPGDPKKSGPRKITVLKKNLMLEEKQNFLNLSWVLCLPHAILELFNRVIEKYFTH